MHLRRRGVHRHVRHGGPREVPISGDPLAIEESDAQRNVLAKFDIDPDQGWDWRKIAAPFTDDDLSSTATVPQLAAVLSGHLKSGRPARGT